VERIGGERHVGVPAGLRAMKAQGVPLAMTEQVTARTGRGLEPRTFRTDARSREGYT
jgi:hypothetical protein